jgi:hypothetical protein
MDFLLIVLAIGGLVFAGVMLTLASRTSRMERESDARVQRLQAMATGSVLFADALIESADDADEVRAVEVRDDTPQAAPRPTFDMTTDAHPFVMTVPAGAGRVPGGFSFDRTPGRRT